MVITLTLTEEAKNRLQQLILHFSIHLEGKYVPDSTYYATGLGLFIYFCGQGQKQHISSSKSVIFG